MIREKKFDFIMQYCVELKLSPKCYCIVLIQTIGISYPYPYDPNRILCALYNSASLNCYDFQTRYNLLMSVPDY